MTAFIAKMFGFYPPTPSERDDFSRFFIDAKSTEKVKVIRQILKDATKEQEMTIRKYNEIKKKQLTK